MLRSKLPPLPPTLDPAKAVDKLPQPYRLIDKILAEIVELSLDICLAKDKQKTVVKATHIDTVRTLECRCMLTNVSALFL